MLHACLHPEAPLLKAAKSISFSSRCLSNTRGCPSQCSLHNAPIFRLLLKVAVNGTHQCESFNFCGDLCPNENTDQQTNKRIHKETNKRLHKQKCSNKQSNKHNNKHTNKHSNNVCLHRNKKHATANHPEEARRFDLSAFDGVVVQPRRDPKGK